MIKSLKTHSSVLRHHFTVDVEEYFQVSALAPYVARSSWESIPTRLHAGMAPLLERMECHGARGTFFVLGWIAKYHPAAVREVVSRGHEVASHGWGHERVTDLTPSQFRASVRDSKAELEDLTGRRVFGYRAPSFSIVRGGEWALEVLVEEGYLYDSSLVPVRRRGYGFAGGQRDPHELQTAAGVLQEFPPGTLKVGPAVLPAGGGAYFRLFPYWLIERALRSAASRGVPGTFYIHPWELDPEQPKIDVPRLTRARHYGGLRRTISRLERLLSTFAFQPICDALGLDPMAPELTVLSRTDDP